MAWLRDLLLTGLSAALYALAFPPVAARALAWVALVPLLLALRSAPLVRRLVLSAAWSLAAGWGVGRWMPGAVANYFGQRAGVGWGLFVFVALTMAAPYYMAFGAAYRPLVKRSGATAPLFVG